MHRGMTEATAPAADQAARRPWQPVEALPARRSRRRSWSSSPPTSSRRSRPSTIPEIPADIYELGLIYKIDIDDERNVAVEMTLTAPGCPVAGEMPAWVENAVASVAGVGQVTVKLTFDPPWDQGRMSDEAKLALGMF